MLHHHQIAWFFNLLYRCHFTFALLVKRSKAFLEVVEAVQWN